MESYGLVHPLVLPIIEVLIGMIFMFYVCKLQALREGAGRKGWLAESFVCAVIVCLWLLGTNGIFQAVGYEPHAFLEG